MIGATRPWINYGLDVATGKLKPKKEKSDDESDDSDEEQPAEPPSAMIMQMGLVVPQVEQFLDVAATLRKRDQRHLRRGRRLGHALRDAH